MLIFLDNEVKIMNEMNGISVYTIHYNISNNNIKIKKG